MTRRPQPPWTALEWFEWLFVLAAVLFAIGFGLLR
jgi:hypothetical protein